MSLLWGWPLGLAAFAAVLLPIWLHLDRRRSMRVLRFAAMRFIGTAHPPKRTWRLTEWLLLALRMLLIAAVVLWLAQPTWVGEWRAPQRVLAVVPGVPPELIRAHLTGVDRAVWLNSELAEIDLANLAIANLDGTKPDLTKPDLTSTAPASASAQPPFSSLLRQLDADVAPHDQLRLLVTEQVDGVDAQAIALARDVEWQIADASRAADDPSSPTVEGHTKRVLAIRYQDADAPALRWLRAAINAWSSAAAMQVALDDQPAAAALPSELDALIWVGDEPTAAAKTALAAGSRLLHLRSSESQTTSDVQDTSWPGRTQRVGLGQMTRLSTPFEPRDLPILHSPEFPEALFNVVFGEPPAPTRAHADQVEPTAISRPAELAKTPLRTWLAWLIAILFLLERALATGRRLRGAR